MEDMCGALHSWQIFSWVLAVHTWLVVEISVVWIRSDFGKNVTTTHDIVQLTSHIHQLKAKLTPHFFQVTFLAHIETSCFDPLYWQYKELYLSSGELFVLLRYHTHTFITKSEVFESDTSLWWIWIVKKDRNINPDIRKTIPYQIILSSDELFQGKCNNFILQHVFLNWLLGF